MSWLRLSTAAPLPGVNHVRSAERPVAPYLLLISSFNVGAAAGGARGHRGETGFLRGRQRFACRDYGTAPSPVQK